MFLKIIASVLTILCVSCASSNTSKLPDGYMGPVSVIKDSNRQPSSVKAEVYTVSEIDGKTHNQSPYEDGYGGDLQASLTKYSRKVPARKVLLTLMATHVDGGDGTAVANALVGKHNSI